MRVRHCGTVRCSPPALILMLALLTVRNDVNVASFGMMTPGKQHHHHFNSVGRKAPTFVAAPPAFRATTTTTTTTVLFAKKKKGGPSPSLAQLDVLDALDDDEPMSKKDQAKAAKKAAKEAKKAAATTKSDAPANANANANANAVPDFFDDDEPMSKKDKMQAAKKAEKEAKKAANAAEQRQDAAVDNEPPPRKKTAAEKAVELMERDEAAAAARAATDGTDDDGPKLSKKELKALKKKQEKEAAKAAKKAAKKAANKAAMEDEEEAASADEVDGSTPVVVADADGEQDETTEATPAVVVEEEEITLEERIRKDRPPPRIRVMESSQPGYVALRLEDVSITFRNQEVLKGVTWGVQTGDRIGLVGPNGGGKTTQLRILAGETEPTAGDVVKSSKDLRVSVLRQEFVDELVPTRSLKEEFLSVFSEERNILDELRGSEEKLAGIDPADADGMQSLLDRMQDLQARADAKDVYNLEGRAKKIMDLMGFTEEEGEAKVRMFSGGWKMRIGLGKVLLNEPNVLLLDEPTNHLDLESVEWLEDFLRNQNIPMVIVSHDREFLDQVCTKIVDTAGGIATAYDGNYSNFLKLKKERMDSWQAAYDAQEKKIKSERQWIRKFKLKQPQAVKQREAQLEKLVNGPDYVQKPPFLGKPFRFRFPDAPRISMEVAEVKKLSHGYTTAGTRNTLFDDVQLSIEKNDRIAVLGPNGSGKSTLLRILMGMEKADEGSAEIVGQNVEANYFQQNQADALDLDKSVIDTVQAASTEQSYNELRALLGQFLFKGDSVEKKVINLSGGEKARLSLSCMMLRPANLLILDEPTNHLDIPAKEMLEEALQHFQGSVVVISHDRYFISKVATTIVAIEDKKLNKYSGDYKFYMDRSKAVKEKIEARYVKGVQRIESAPVIDLEEIEQIQKTKKFGGGKNANMVTRTDKGVKNAKRQNRK